MTDAIAGKTVYAKVVRKKKYRSSSRVIIHNLCALLNAVDALSISDRDIGMNRKASSIGWVFDHLLFLREELEFHSRIMGEG